MSAKLIRTIHPEIRIVDTARGIADYVASDQSLDSYNEIIRADGWRFTNFQRNAPFVDSHCYDSIDKLLGKVISFQVTGGKLVERVQWAIGIGNPLGDLGWNMTKADMLKAVSVGFFPVQYLTPNSGSAWAEALEALELPADAPVRTIYTQQEQVELSACIVGANPNALLAAKSAGLLNDTHLEKFPELRRALAKRTRRLFSFPTQTKSASSKEDFMKTFNVLTHPSGVPTPKRAYDNLEMLRRHAGTDDELNHALTQARVAVARERHHSGLDPVERFLAVPGRREYLNGLVRFLKGVTIPREQKQFFQERLEERQAVLARDLGVTPAVGGVEAFLLEEGMSEDLFDLLLIYGAYQTLGLRTLVKNYTKFSKTTGRPGAVFITPSMSVGTAITKDAAFAGAQLLPLANMVASLVNVSLQLLEDSAVDLSRVFLENFTQGLAARIDFACFVGNGANDANNGAQTGIFNDNTIQTIAAAAGNISAASLDRQDFLNCLGAINPAALQRPCNFWLHPGFQPLLLKIEEGQTGSQYLLKTPSETGDTWRILGYPIIFTAQAPATDGPDQPVAAFGHGDSYLVNLSEQFTIENSDQYLWNTLQASYRAWARVYCETRESTGLVKLTTAGR